MISRRQTLLGAAVVPAAILAPNTGILDGLPTAAFAAERALPMLQAKGLQHAAAILAIKAVIFRSLVDG